MILKIKKKIIKSRNTHSLKRNKGEISELHDEFLISEQIKKLLLQKEPKIIYDKPMSLIQSKNQKAKKLVKKKDEIEY